MEFYIKVTPGAKKDRFLEENGQIKIYLTAPAVDNKANEALIEFIVKNLQCVGNNEFGWNLVPLDSQIDLFSDLKYLKIRKSDVSVIKGLKSRTKTIKILT